MGWLDRIFGKKEEKFEETAMSLKEAEDFLSSKLKRDFESLKEPIKKEYENLQIAAANMQSQLKILEHAPYSVENEPILIRKAVGSRKSFVSKMKSLAQQMQKPIGEDMISILNFHNETAKLINDTNEKAVMEYEFLKELFEKEAKKIIQSFRQIVEIDKRLGDLVKEFTESNFQLLKAQEVIAEVLELTEELKKRNEMELEKEMEELEDESKKTESELKKLVESNEWKGFLEMQRIKEELKSMLQNKKSDFIQCVARIEKPLKKYKWSVESKILDDYEQNSLESVLSEDPKGEVFLSAIKDIKTKIAEGKMDLKDSDKFLDAIESLIEDNTMGEILEGYSRLSGELRSQEEKIELQGIQKRKSDLESEISKLRRGMEEIKIEGERFEEKKKQMQADKEKKLNELGNLMNAVSGKRILLELN